MIAGRPFQCTHNFIPQELAVRRLRKEVELAPETDRFDLSAPSFEILDAPSLESSMSRFMYDGGSELLKGHCVLENITFIEYASVQRPIVVRLSAGEQVHPYSIEVADDAGIVERVMALDNLQGLFHAAPRRVGLALGRPNPKPLDCDSFGQPDAQLVDAGGFSVRRCGDGEAARSLRRFELLQTSPHHVQIALRERYIGVSCFQLA